MLRTMKWITPVAGLALVLGFNQLSKAADEAPAAGKATVNVTVQDKDGKGVWVADAGERHPSTMKKLSRP